MKLRFLAIFIFLLFMACAVFVSCVPQTATTATTIPAEEPQIDNEELQQQIKMYLSLGFENYKNKQYDRAIEHFRKVLELDPQNEKAFKYLSDSYLRYPDSTYIDTALSFYNEAIANFPENAQYYAGLGYVYKKIAGKYENIADTTNDSSKMTECHHISDSLEELARQNFVMAITYNKEDATSASALGTIWLRNGKLDSSRVWFEYCVDIDSNRVEAWKILAKIYMVRNMNEEAAVAYSHLARLVPEEPEYLLRMGQFYAKTGKFQEAVEILQQYIDAHPNDYRGYQYMGLALAADGKYSEALEQLKKAKDLNPDCEICMAKIMCDIASLYKDMKKYSSAETYIAKAKSHDSSYGYIYIVEGEIIQQRAMAQVPESFELNMEIKCQFLKANRVYRKAFRDPDWLGIAQSKIDYLKPYIPTGEEIASYKFITGNSCGE